MKIGIIGSAGRMGQALVDAIAADGQEYAGGVDKGDDLAALVVDGEDDTAPVIVCQLTIALYAKATFFEQFVFPYLKSIYAFFP